MAAHRSQEADERIQAARERLASGSADEVRALLQAVLDEEPEHPAAWSIMGDLHHQAGELEEAIACYERSIAGAPADVSTRYGLGGARLALRDFAPAAMDLALCLEHAPTFAAARHNLAEALFGLGRVDDAVGQFLAATESKDETIRELGFRNAARIVPGSPSAGNAEILGIRRHWGQTYVPREEKPAPRDRGDGPIRVGYVSSFFHSRNWMKPVWGLLNEHDRERFELHLFTDSDPLEFGAGYRRPAADQVHDIRGLSNAETAALMRAQELDLLVDLNAYSKTARLPVLGLGPAPLVVGWFNHYATSGLSCVDAVIGDEHVVPKKEERFYLERILRVPGTYLAFAVDYPVPEVTPPPCCETGHLTFGSLLSQYKLTSDVLDDWARILRQAENTRLLLRNAELGRSGNCDYVRAAFVERGVDPDRLELLGPADHFEFLRTYDRIDVALDAHPYNGGTTTMEAIWQGVPVLAFAGDRWAARTSASLLRAAGLSNFVVPDRDALVAWAVELAKDPGTPDLLREVRGTMRSSVGASRACDTKALARSIEALYVELLQA